MNLWYWNVQGTQISHGTMLRHFEEEGYAEAELAAEVFHWLAQGEAAGVESIHEEWPLDALDMEYEFTVTIRPVDKP